MDLKDLYRDVIVDHNKHPRNFGHVEHPDAHADGHNPLCGDQLTVTVKLDGDVITDVKFEGSGCAISTASASLIFKRRWSPAPDLSFPSKGVRNERFKSKREQRSPK